jgi:hypothetical protein
MAASKTVPPAEKMTLAQRIAINSAPAWRPQKGDILIGRLLGTRIGGTTKEAGGYGLYPVLVLDKLDTDGEPTGEYLALHAFHTLVVTPIIEMLKKKELVRGGDVTVSYLGLREKNVKNAKGEVETYHNYFVEPGKGDDKVLDMDDPANFPF